MKNVRAVTAVLTTIWVAAFWLAVTAVPAAGTQEPAPRPTAAQQDIDETRAKTLFTRVCTECHPTDRILASRRTRTQWGEVMEEMIAQGAKMDDEEYGDILAWLVARHGRVYVNVAPEDEMVEVLGLTEADAEKIVAYRKEHGKFADFDALLKVPAVSTPALTAAKAAIAF